MTTTKKQVETEEKPEPLKIKGKIYYSKSAGHRLSGYKKQVKHPDGSMTADVPIIFQNHLFITDDIDKQEFIESRSCFGERGGFFITEIDVETYQTIAGKGTFTEKLKRSISTGAGERTVVN